MLNTAHRLASFFTRTIKENSRCTLRHWPYWARSPPVIKLQPWFEVGGLLIGASTLQPPYDTCTASTGRLAVASSRTLIAIIGHTPCALISSATPARRKLLNVEITLDIAKWRSTICHKLASALQGRELRRVRIARSSAKSRFWQQANIEQRCVVE